MKKTCERVDYKDRLHILDNKTALVWPFLNSPRTNGPCELFLDTNALLHPEWLDCLSIEFLSKCTINLWFALTEQWVSNPEFTSATEKTISLQIQPFVRKGFQFHPDFSVIQANLLKLNDAQIKYQHSISYPYIAILKKIIKNNNVTDSMDLLVSLSNSNVPRLSGCLMLGAFILFCKSRQSLRLLSDDNTVFSYLDSFFAFHVKKKNENNYITQDYLRNRAGDIGIWYSIPALMQQGYTLNSDAVIVTGDKALHRLIFRVVPPVIQENKIVSFNIDLSCLDEKHHSDFFLIYSKLNFKSEAPKDDNEKNLRLRNLYDFAKMCGMTLEEKNELESAFTDWAMPGFGKLMNTNY